MLYDAPLSQRYAARLLEEGIYVTGFYYPVAVSYTHLDVYKRQQLRLELRVKVW